MRPALYLFKWLTSHLFSPLNSPPFQIQVPWSFLSPDLGSTGEVGSANRIRILYTNQPRLRTGESRIAVLPRLCLLCMDSLSDSKRSCLPVCVSSCLSGRGIIRRLQVSDDPRQGKTKSSVVRTGSISIAIEFMRHSPAQTPQCRKVTVENLLSLQV